MIKSRSKVKRYKNKRIRDLSALLTSEDLVGMERVRVIMALEKEYAMIAQHELEKKEAVERATKKAEAVGVKKAEETIIKKLYYHGMSTPKIASMTDYTVEAVENIINGILIHD